MTSSFSFSFPFPLLTSFGARRGEETGGREGEEGTRSEVGEFTDEGTSEVGRGSTDADSGTTDGGIVGRTEDEDREGGEGESC